MELPSWAFRYWHSFTRPWSSCLCPTYFCIDFDIICCKPKGSSLAFSMRIIVSEVPSTASVVNSGEPRGRGLEIERHGSQQYSSCLLPSYPWLCHPSRQFCSHRMLPLPLFRPHNLSCAHWLLMESRQILQAPLKLNCLFLRSTFCQCRWVHPSA